MSISIGTTPGTSGTSASHNTRVDDRLSTSTATTASTSKKSIADVIKNFEDSILVFNDVGIAYHNPKQKLIETMLSAKKNIKMSMYDLTDENAIKALETLFTRNVKIDILVEKDPDVLIKRLERMNSLISIKKSPRNVLVNHSKFIIVDNKKIVVSTANLDSYDKPSRNFVVSTNDKDIIQIASEIFDFDFKNEDTTLKTVVNENLVFNNKGLYLGNGSVDKKTDIYVDYWMDFQVNLDKLRCVGSTYYAYQKLIKSAKKDIYIYMQVLNDYSIVDLLVEAKKRNVNVKVICQDLGQSGRQVLKLIEYILISNGVQILINNTKIPYVHAKVCIVDNMYAIVGSTNFTHASLCLNREMDIGVKGESVAIMAKRFLKDFEILNDHNPVKRKYKDNDMGPYRDKKGQGKKSKNSDPDIAVNDLL